jgi:translation initiation factor 4B
VHSDRSVLGPRLASAAPAERRRLNLAPRSVPQSPATTAPEPASARASIFGGAKPIDSATKEKEAADKLAAKGEERRQAQIKAKEDEERKSKELAEERQRMIREAQEKAQAEVSGGKPRGAGAGAGTGAGAGAGGARPGRGGAPGQSGPGRRTSGDVRSPTSPRAKSHPVQTATEDGFEAVARGGARKTNQSAAAAATEQQKKDSGVKKGFSFAAAAMAEGLVDEDKDESGDNAVDEVTNGVKEVAV